MKFKKLLLISLLLMILTIGVVSASQDVTQDNLTYVDEDIQEASILDEPACDEVLGQFITVDEDDQNESGQNGEEVLGLEKEDINVKVNTKTIDATKKNTVIATITLPKGTKGYVEIFGDNIPGLQKKLSKIKEKKTKKGHTTYTIRLKDFMDYERISEDLINKGDLSIGIKFYSKEEGGYDWGGNRYLIKVNKKAKTFKLKRKVQANVWAYNYDRRSGSNKKLAIKLGVWPSEKGIAGKKVKITINGVIYYKKTNSKGMIYIYPPKYLPPKQFTKVKMEFAGDDKYTDCMTINDIEIYKNPGSSKSKIKASSKTFLANKTKKYTIKLVSKGKAIKKAKLKLIINGKKYYAKTNSKGKATFDLSKLTKKGKFKGTILYMGDKKHYMSYKNVKLTVK